MNKHLQRNKRTPKILLGNYAGTVRANERNVNTTVQGRHDEYQAGLTGKIRTRRETLLVLVLCVVNP